MGICKIVNIPEVAFVMGDPVEFDYTGTIQTYTIPSTGLYKLEVWGAQKGGYSVGYKELHKNDVLYIVCGGIGSINSFTVQSGAGDYGTGGYNGGGRLHLTEGSNTGNWQCGGGATHIATVSGLLASLSAQRNNVLIVAGGGGGNIANYGGTGGGTTGGNGSKYASEAAEHYCYYGTGGTQTAGGAAQYHTTGTTVAAFGRGGNAYIDHCYQGEGGAGGGGWFGGGGGYVEGGGGQIGGGGGGSGYIGGVPEVTYKGKVYPPGTTNGANSGAGHAAITRVA